jgi:ADP-heptose:LPS heptosyltransferase
MSKLVGAVKSYGKWTEGGRPRIRPTGVRTGRRWRVDSITGFASSGAELGPAPGAGTAANRLEGLVRAPEIRVLDSEPRSIALVRLRTGLGDLLCSVPAVRALRARLPAAHIALITFAEMAPVVARQRPYVDELIAFPGWPGIPERPVDDDALPRFLAGCAERRFDLAIQMYGARPAANLVTEALGARRIAGFFTPGAWAPPDLDAFLPYPEHLHETDRHLALMELLGAPSAGRRLEFPVSDDDLAEAEEVRERHGVDSGYVLVHPGATSASRRWPPERFAAVADGLARDGLPIAVTGVRGEEEVTHGVVSAMGAPAADLCAATSLGGFAALLRGARLLVCSDTGAAHLAAAMGVPTVVVFLSGNPVRWSHPGHRVARVEVGCNPCPHLECPIDFRCAGRLTPAGVLTEARAALRDAPVLPAAD